MDELIMPAPAEAPAYSDSLRFEFRGSATEYFRIWIVNVMLTLVTFGIYSAWAKVRTRRYFLGNTVLADSTFDFHADPIKVLKGRIIVGAFFLVYAVAGRFSPVISALVVATFFLVYPWIIVRALAFNLRNTSYRGVRFGFSGKVAESYAAYAKAYLVTLFTLGLATPSAIHRSAIFRINNSRYGSAKFSFAGGRFEMYSAFYGAALVYALGILGVLIVTFLFRVVLGKSSVEIAALFVYLVLFLAVGYFRATYLNHIANTSRLGRIRFKSDLRFHGLAFLYLTNVVACLCTLGLLIPWAMVRVLKYRMAHTVLLVPPGEIETFVAEGSRTAEAFGDAAADFLDIDLGF